jgi:hypothetical protein
MLFRVACDLRFMDRLFLEFLFQYFETMGDFTYMKPQEVKT